MHAGVRETIADHELRERVTHLDIRN